MNVIGKLNALFEKAESYPDLFSFEKEIIELVIKGNEEAYSRGFEEGEEAGYSSGWSEGYACAYEDS